MPRETKGTNDDELLKLCDDALSACSETVTNLREQVEEQDRLVGLLRRQRNEALSDVVENEPTLPAVVWVIIGGAAGVLAMEFAR